MIFPSNLTLRKRRVYQAATIFFVVVFFAMMWPIYSLFSRIEPRIFGLPFSLAYLIGLLLATFFVLLALYRWERRSKEE